jgi:hypothetical protein
LGVLVLKCQDEFKSDPKSLTVQYEYFYALWLNRWENDVEYTLSQSDDMAQFTFDFDKLRYPRTYNFTRLGALCDDYWILDLFPFLQRLERKDPSDLLAQFYFPEMLASTGKPALQLQAIRLADQLAAKHAENVKVRVCQGYAYYRRWLTTKDPMMAQKAVAGYQAYIDRTIPNGHFRSAATWVIDQIKKG